jgi:hypothetical protein
MGPLFFLVLLVPFTINGFACARRSSSASSGASACPPTRRSPPGFLFFLVSAALALPGAAILLWENLRGGRSRPRLEHG